MEQAGNLVKNLIKEFHQRLARIYPEQEIRQFIYILFEAYLGWPKTRVHVSLDARVPELAMNAFVKALEELADGKPVQYILGQAWFNGTMLKVDRNVLVPRPETEELCAMIRMGYPGRHNHPASILDIGTGSGCIAIDLKKYFQHSEVTAVDISTGALEIAKGNASSCHCDISFVHADILDEADRATLGRFDLIVSNPPYVTEREKTKMHRNVTEFEPAQALFVADGDPLVFYRAIAGFAASHLVPPGYLYFEINEKFGKEVAGLVSSFGFEEVCISLDFHGKERFVSAVLKSSPALPGQ
ncbi:MAG: peptide chain release factor N(5)-glutamine methyltransferase [Bacteroidetes bacterium]|nr:peptide chain release factor N(5)-glutamine methyltransferase [Bacteroidota bacterium]